MTARQLRAAIVEHFGSLGGWIILPKGAVITLIQRGDRICFVAPRGSRDAVGDEPLLEAMRSFGCRAFHVRSVKEACRVAGAPEPAE